MKFAVVILAAGRSSRMGCHKMLLPWGESTVIAHSIELWTRLGAAQVAAVCDVRDTALKEELGRLAFPKENVINNAHAETGMFGSIRCAAAWEGWQPGLSHWIISLGDQPHLRPATLQSLILCADGQPGRIWQPAFRRKPCHPVMLSEDIFKEIAGETAVSLKDFLNARANLRSLCDSDDPGLDFDIDTPADYETARSRFLG